MRRNSARGVRTLLAVYAAAWLMTAALAFPRAAAIAQTVAGDPAQGRVAFEKRCTGCHSLDRNMEGPRLRGVYGRQAGTVTDFSYSDALKAAHFTWDGDLLEKWLAGPDSLVPGVDMDFHVANQEERANIIQYLRLSSGK